MRYLQFGSSMMVIAILASTASAQAQESRVSEPGTIAREPTVIVVTAQKREQTLAEIPQSISVLGGKQLEEQQATSFVDYAAQVPGLSLQQSNPGQTRIILRGVNTGGASPTAAIYVDETPFSPSTGQANGAVLAGDIDTFDIERLEVLRGPQGTLYGANSLGGLIKFVTVKPKLGEYEARVRAGVELTEGGDPGYSGNVVANVPVGDTLAVRASGYYRKSGGFIDTIGIDRENANDFDSYGGRASLLFEPIQDFSIRLTALAQNIRANSQASFDVDPLTHDPIKTDPATGAPLDGRLVRTEYFPEKNDVDYRVYSATVDWDFGPASLTSVTSYGTLDQSEAYDVTYQLPGIADAVFGGLYPDAGPLGVVFPASASQKKFTQELRLDSAVSDRFEWLVGGYYTKETGLLLQAYTPFPLNEPQPLDPTLELAPGIVFDDFLTATLDSEYEEYAAFGSVTFFLSDRFDITAGGRYSHNEQETSQILDGSLLVLSGATPDEVPEIVEGNSSENVFTWSVAPRFEISDLTTFYARVAKGYRPGGPNVVPPGAGSSFPTQFDADTLISYEAGVRAETPGQEFSIDASVYYLDWRDIQVLVTYNTDIGPVGADGNGETATSKGAEITATLRPTRGLDLVASMAYSDAKLDEDLPDGNGGFAGDRLPYAPEWTANFAADYEWSLGGETTAFVGGNVRLVSDQAGNFDANYQEAFGRRLKLDGYASADLRAGVRLERFSINAYMRNVTNSRGLTGLGDFLLRPGTTLSAAPIRPRTYGVTVGAEF
ncbi:TonB-dependent receptor [Qipengyuania sp. 483]